MIIDTNRRRRQGVRQAGLVLVSLTLTALAVAPEVRAAKQQDNEDTAAEDFQYPPYTGLRNTVAVSKFDAHGAFVAQYGGWDIGGGMAAMLASELTQTDQFIVLDRSDLNDVLKEQELGLSNLTGTGAPQSGQLLGAQYLLRGSVTEFSEGNKGGGFSAAVGTSKLIPALGRRTRKGHVTIDLRLIDTTTGQIILAETVDKELKTKSTAFELSSGNRTIGGDAFNKTALGAATRAAIQEAVGLVVNQMRDVRWQAMVAAVEGDRVYVNAGSNANLVPGVTLICRKSVNQIVDPVTGAVLGTEQVEIGEIHIEQVADRYAVGRFRGRWAPDTGDTVYLADDRPMR